MWDVALSLTGGSLGGPHGRCLHVHPSTASVTAARRSTACPGGLLWTVTVTRSSGCQRKGWAVAAIAGQSGHASHHNSTMACRTLVGALVEA